MQAYRLPPVAGLSSQLKRGPRRLRLRQLLNIEFLLTVVETGRQYPMDFVCHALTGFRPPDKDGADAKLLGGEALRQDLLTLAEDLSADADVTKEALQEPVFSVSDLAGRFDVSTKTIFRWHRRGLVGWRFRCEDRRVRLAFPDRCVRRFVAENADLVHRGSAFSQLTDPERNAVIDRARELALAGEKTVNAVARVIAGETGRAVETIRLILKRFDELHPQRGVFNRPLPNVDVDDKRLAVWEAYCDGGTMDALAARFERPVAWIYAAVTHMRAKQAKATQIEFIPSAEFTLPEADAVILQAPQLASPYSEDAGRRPSTDLPPYLQQLFRSPLLSAAGEAALFRKMNYLRFKADQTRQALDPDTATAAELDRIEALLCEANAVKNQITQANLRLVVSIAKKHNPLGADFFETVSDGNISLMRAVDKFDYSRGFKFSTYASWAIMKNYARSIPEKRERSERFQTGREELLEVSAAAAPDERDEDLPGVRATVDRMLGMLEERERVILRQRYGLEGGGESLTLEQIGTRLGVSKERVRQLEARAISKLRSEFDLTAMGLAH